MPDLEDHKRFAASVPNPFLEDGPSRVTEYTAQQIATLQSRLDKQLGPEYVSTRPGNGGGRVHYLASEKVINLANEVFGFNGWSSTIRDVQIDFVDENPTTGRISLGLSVIVRVTLKDGAHHEDIGYGQIENAKGKAAAFEKAKKEGVTDGMKRALRNFGNVLGNCLYDKDYLSRISKIKLKPAKWDEKNLHRHPAYAEVKQEPQTEETGAAPAAAEATRAQAGPSRTGTAQSVPTSRDAEDEFGEDMFDEADFGHPDEVVLHDVPELAPTSRVNTRPPNGGPAPAGRQASGANGTMNPQNAPQPTHQRPQQAQSRPTPQTSNQPPSGRQFAPNIQQDTSHPPQNQLVRAHPHNPQQHTRALPAPAQAQAQPGRTTSSNHAGQPQPPRQTPPQAANPPLDPSDPSFPVAFVHSRAAEALNQKRDPTAVESFNVKAMSPGLRRTEGFDHSRSGPVHRQSLPGAANGTAASPLANNSSAASAAVGGGRNFVNPAAEAHRRIGAPNAGAQSPYRGQYKPPGPPPQPVTGKRMSDAGGRVPLGDVSNLKTEAGVVGQGDEKRPKTEMR